MVAERETCMADHDELIELLNQAVSLEYTAAIQYNQHSMLLTGTEKRLYEDLFNNNSRESLGHAKMWGDRIVYLGGVPKAEVGAIRQSPELAQMLEINLEIEKKAVEIYSRAHKACKHEATRYMLENHILEEDKDVEELQKYLGKVAVAEDTRTWSRAQSGSAYKPAASSRR
jgi:bacterioferritin